MAVGQGALRWSGRLPLSRQAAFATDDPEVALARACDLLGAHQMTLPSGAAGFSARVNAQRWPTTMLTCFSYGAPVRVSARDGPVFYGVNLPLTGHADVGLRGARVQASPRCAFVLSGAPATVMRWSADYSVLCLTVEPTALERHLARLTGQPVDRPIEFQPAMPLPAAGLAWMGVVQMLLDLAERAGQRGAGPSLLLRAEVETAVMTTLLVTQPHSYSGALLDQPAAGGRVVAAAIEIMRSPAGARMTVAEIAEQVGVSERSLQLSFRRQLGVRPSEHLRDLRLEAARRELLAAPAGEKSVSRIAHDWGFSNLGRFACRYRVRFGENPSQTARHGA